MSLRRPVIHAIVLLLLTATAAQAAGRHRAVRTPSLGCSYAIAPSPAFTGGVSWEGADRLAVGVMPLDFVAGCGSWTARSLVDWITVEAEPGNAWITVAPNLSPETRAGVVMIAAMPYEVVQSGRVNHVSNGGFDRDVSGWSWNDFPNSTGSAKWSSLDARASAVSGSMQLRDGKTGDQAFQRMQCVSGLTGEYEYGFTVRSELPEVMQPVIAIVGFEGAGCTGTYDQNYRAKAVKVAQSGVWESHLYSGILAPRFKSVMVVLGSYAKSSAASQEVWIDDVFIRPADID